LPWFAQSALQAYSFYSKINNYTNDTQNFCQAKFIFTGFLKGIMRTSKAREILENIGTYMA
jgi:hypothetical protein